MVKQSNTRQSDTTPTTTVRSGAKRSGRFKRILHRYYRLFGVLFALLIFGLAILTVLLPDQDYSTSEKRSLAKFPEFSLSSVADGSFMDGIEDWAADQFPLRDKLMQAKSGLSIGLGAIRSQDVYRCDDGSLMEAFSLPSDDLINAQTTAIIDFAERYPDTDIYFCLVPTAISVLEEKLPAAALTDDQNVYLDRMGNAVAEVSTVVDLRDTFAKHKGTAELYYHTDHHWTTDAAYLAWKDLSDVMALDSDLSYTAGIVCNDFSGSLLSASGFSANAYDSIKVYVPEENPLYTLTYDTEKRMTASVYCPEYLDSEDPYQIFFGGNYPKLTIRTAQDTGRKLLIFKDSYANCLIPFLIPDFTQITVIDPRYYYDDLDMEIQSVGYTDVLFLYNANTLAEDSCLVPVLQNEQLPSGNEPAMKPTTDPETQPSPETHLPPGNKPVTETVSPSESELTTVPIIPPGTNPTTESDIPPETLPAAPPAGSPETEPPTTPAPVLTVDDIAFIGDSRTLTMAVGGRYEFGLIPASSVFATWGGELTQDSARQNAQAAASANRKLAIFWYGINDVQSDPEQKLSAAFKANYAAIIDLYQKTNPDSEIVILSILSTSVHEKDYYTGQEENIRTYNAALASLCAEKGYTYLDITSTFTGDECLAEGDYIHFSKKWYEEIFLPTVFQTLGIVS